MRLLLEGTSDALDLNGIYSVGTGAQATAGLTGLGLPPVSTQWIAGAGNGARFRGSRVLPRDIDVPIYFQGDDHKALEDLSSRLAMILANPCILRLIEEDGTSWYTEVVRVGGGSFVYGVDTSGGTDLAMIITLRAGDPFWTSSELSSKTISNSSTGRGLLSNLSKLQVASSQAIGEITLANTGDAPAYPVWTVHGPGSNFHAESEDGQSFTWTGTLTVGQSLIVDTRDGSVRDGTGANRYTNMASAPRFWAIPPGTITATASLADAVAGQSSITCEWRPRKWMVI